MTPRPICATGRAHSFLQFCKDEPRYRGLAQLIEDLPSHGAPAEPQQIWELLSEASALWKERITQ